MKSWRIIEISWSVFVNYLFSISFDEIVSWRTVILRVTKFKNILIISIFNLTSNTRGNNENAARHWKSVTTRLISKTVNMKSISTERKTKLKSGYFRKSLIRRKRHSVDKRISWFKFVRNQDVVRLVVLDPLYRVWFVLIDNFMEIYYHMKSPRLSKYVRWFVRARWIQLYWRIHFSPPHWNHVHFHVYNVHSTLLLFSVRYCVMIRTRTSSPATAEVNFSVFLTIP